MANEMNVSIPGAPVSITSRDVTVQVDVSALPHDIIRQLVVHGLTQKVADAASGVFASVWRDKRGDAPLPKGQDRATFLQVNASAIAQETEAQMLKAADALLRGDWVVRQAGGTVSRATEEERLAMRMAQAALGKRFGAAVVGRGLHAGPAEKVPAHLMAQLGDKVAEFFDETANGRVRWSRERLREYIRTQAETEGGIDYMAQAREELARQAEFLAEAVETVEDDFADL